MQFKLGIIKGDGIGPEVVNEANIIENAVEEVLNEGYRTGDIMSKDCKLVGTSEMGDLIISKI